MGCGSSLKHQDVRLGVSDLQLLHFFLMAGLLARLQEFRGMLANTDMVGIRVHPSPMAALYKPVLDNVPSSICIGSLLDHEGSSSIASHYFFSFGLRHSGQDRSSSI